MHTSSLKGGFPKIMGTFLGPYGTEFVLIGVDMKGPCFSSTPNGASGSSVFSLFDNGSLRWGCCPPSISGRFLGCFCDRGTLP